MAISKQVERITITILRDKNPILISRHLPAAGNRPEGVEKWIKKSLEDLQLEYLDLYLIHTPFGIKEVGEDLHPTDENGEIIIDRSTNHREVWAAMEKQVELGRTRMIGLSNFNIHQIAVVLKYATMKISVLQIELHVYFQQNELINRTDTMLHAAQQLLIRSA